MTRGNDLLSYTTELRRAANGRRLRQKSLDARPFCCYLVPALLSPRNNPDSFTPRRLLARRGRTATGMNHTAFAYAGLTGNGLVDLLDSDDSRRLLPFGRIVRLEARQTLHAPGGVLEHVFFPAGSVAAVLTYLDDGAAVETALVGREGVVGLNAALGERRARHCARVIVPGDALRVGAPTLRELFAESRLWRGLLLRYYGTLIGHVSRRAVCNTRHRLHERLCTWLLMMLDRAGPGDLPLTQEAVARQLGVRRAGVNECLVRLALRGTLGHGRGRIRVLSREALEGEACACYAGLKAEARWFDAPDAEEWPAPETV